MLQKERVVFRVKGEKPTRFRFRGGQRFGFKGSKLVEVVKYKRA